MSKKRTGFREYVEENELRKRPIKKESRHNYRARLMDVIEEENWDELEDQLDEQGRIHRR
jgi:hypothetical protein